MLWLWVIKKWAGGGELTSQFQNRAAKYILEDQMENFVR